MKAESEILNKELGWLRFNERVLFQSIRSDVPLLERLHFINIFHSNLDEFFMKRISRLLRRSYGARVHYQHAAADVDRDIETLFKEVIRLNRSCEKHLSEELLPALKEKQIELLSWADLKPGELKWATSFFKEKLFPVITPMAVDKGHPFPLISNLTFSLAIEMRDPGQKERLFARIKVPEMFPNWNLLPRTKGDNSFRFLSTIDLIKNHLEMAFPGMEIFNVMPFQLTRGLDVRESGEEDAEDLVELIAEEIKLRRFADVVRLEVPRGGSRWLINFLKDELSIDDRLVFEHTLRLEYKRILAPAKLHIAKLRFPKHKPRIPSMLLDSKRSIFSLLKTKDILVHHPFESFEASVERFVNEAADDPEVISIKMTLYRAGEKSSIIDALKRASRNGKQVVCVIELKARLDEARNIQWARVLEDEGVHVVYGMVSLKTHAKVTLVVRQEKKELRTYAHIGTGNYNPQTAHLYTDLGLFTADKSLCEELTEVFHYLTGRSRKRNYNRVLMSPITMREKFLEFIEREAKHAEQSKPAHIIAKFNNFDDPEIIEALIEAAKKGVKINLIVRGFSALAPAEHTNGGFIRVRSIIGRFLEHSRIFFFSNGNANIQDGDFYIGSADWMRRNLEERVEIVVPVVVKDAKAVLSDYLLLLLSEKIQRWDMKNDGSYTYIGLHSLPHVHDVMINQVSSSKLRNIQAVFS